MRHSDSPVAAVRTEISGPVATVVLHRPEVRNAVDPATARSLQRACVELDRDPAIGAVVLWGEGGAFCSGFDLKSLAAGRAAAWLQELSFGEDGEPPLGPMGPTRLEMSKPVIAAVAGPAVAGGMELALWCDLRILEEDASLGVFCRRWGVPLMDGGTVRLPRLIGESRALDLILTGRRVDAAECLQIGLCNRLVPTNGARQAAEALAAEICRFPTRCLRADRHTARAQGGLAMAEALRLETQGAQAALGEAIEGAGRFAAGKGRHGDFRDI